MPQILLTTEQLAARFQVSPDTVKHWSSKGRIPTIWLSRTVRRFDFDEVLRVIRGTAQECAADSTPPIGSDPATGQPNSPEG